MYSLTRQSSPHNMMVWLPCQTQSRQEVKYRHTLDAALTIYRSEGPRAFYRGLLPSLLGITHVAVQFPLYEQLKIWARERLFIFMILGSVNVIMVLRRRFGYSTT
jgi:hypothetical protein